MSNPSKILPDGAFRDTVMRRMEEWRADKCNVPSVYIQLHEKAAKADIPRLMQEVGCKYASFTFYTYGNKDPHMKFVRIFADCTKTGRVRDFFWSDGNGGGWHWNEGGGIRRNEPPAEGKIYL